MESKIDQTNENLSEIQEIDKYKLYEKFSYTPYVSSDQYGMDIGLFQYYKQLGNRKLIINDDIDEGLVERIILPLLDMATDETNLPITLYMNTNGGSISEGSILANVLECIQNPVNVIVLGRVYSVGCSILCACAGNPCATTYAFPFSSFMLHESYLSMDARMGSAKTLISYCQAEEQRLNQLIFKNTKITPEMFDQYKNIDWYFSAEEAKEYGIVDYIIRSECKK